MILCIFHYCVVHTIVISKARNIHNGLYSIFHLCIGYEYVTGKNKIEIYDYKSIQSSNLDDRHFEFVFVLLKSRRKDPRH